MIEILLKLPFIYSITGTERFFFPVFTISMIILFGLAIERLIAYIRMSIRVKRNTLLSLFSENQSTKALLIRLEYHLNRWNIVFVLITLFSLFRISLGFYHNILLGADVYQMVGELDPLVLSHGLMMVAADGIIITLTAFISLLFYLLFHMWKKSIIFHCRLRLLDSNGDQ